jgi:hypothetical protein
VTPTFTEPAWVLLLSDALDALDAADRWWLDQPELDDRALFAWHEVCELRAGLARLLDRDRPGGSAGSDAVQSLHTAAGCLTEAAALTGPPTDRTVIGYQLQLRHLLERLAR